jgi:hypothetical protein
MRVSQDFPYYFEDNVQHWLLWSSDKPLEQAAIQEQIAAKFPQQQWEHIMFVNPAALQSVLAVSGGSVEVGGCMALGDCVQG